MRIAYSIVIGFCLFVFSCTSDKEKAKESVYSKLKLELFNFTNFEIEGEVIRVGTAKSYYFENETPIIEIRNLPIDRYLVKINGKDVLPESKNGIYEYKLVGGLGTKINLVQIFNDNNIELVRHEVVYDIGKVRPFINSEHGRFLFHGVSSNISISNIAMTCPYFILSSNQATISKNADGTYQIIPNEKVDSVQLLLQIMSNVFKQTYQVIDAPLPYFEVLRSTDSLCLELVSSKLFSKIDYEIVEINGVKVNSNCVKNEEGANVEKFAYSVNESNKKYDVFLD